MIDSNFESEHQMRVIWYVVFDPRDGRVVNLHKFINAADVENEVAEAEARERMALQFAEWDGDLSNLRVMQVPVDFCVEEGATYRIDIRANKLVEVMARPSIREATEAIRARKVGKELDG